MNKITATLITALLTLGGLAATAPAAHAKDTSWGKVTGSQHKDTSWGKVTGPQRKDTSWGRVHFKDTSWG